SAASRVVPRSQPRRALAPRSSLADAAEPPPGLQVEDVKLVTVDDVDPRPGRPDELFAREAVGGERHVPQPLQRAFVCARRLVFVSVRHGPPLHGNPAGPQHYSVRFVSTRPSATPESSKSAAPWRRGRRSPPRARIIRAASRTTRARIARMASSR